MKKRQSAEGKWSRQHPRINCEGPRPFLRGPGFRMHLMKAPDIPQVPESGPIWPSASQLERSSPFSEKKFAASVLMERPEAFIISSVALYY